MMPEVTIAIIAVGVQIIALIIAWLGIVNANRKSVQESEQRITARIDALEVSNGMLSTKMERAEDDIQRIWNAIPKRAGEM